MLRGWDLALLKMGYYLLQGQLLGHGLIVLIVIITLTVVDTELGVVHAMLQWDQGLVVEELRH